MTERTRRSALSAVAALAAGAVAGCFGDGGGSTPTETREPGGTPTDSPDPTATTTPTGTTATPVVDPLRWRAEFDHPVRAPAVTDDAVYVTAATTDFGSATSTPTERSGTVAAVDPADGSDRWRETASPPPIRPPVAAGDAAYVVTGGGNGFAGEANRLLKFSGGEERWRTDPVDQFLSPLAAGDDRVFAGTHDDAIDDQGQRLFGVDDATGEPEWTVESGDAWGGWLRDGTLFVDEGGLALSARDPADGAERWGRPGEVLTTADRDLVTAAGTVFAGTSGEGSGGIVALETGDGSVRWRYDDVGDATVVPTGATTHGDTVVGTEYGGWVFGLAAADGTERWTFPTDGDVRSPPVAVGDAVVVGDGTGTVYGIDAGDGTELWRHDAPGEYARPFPTAGGVVLVPSRGRDGGVPYRALDAGGNERWSYTPERPLSTAAVVESGLFLGREDGTLLSIGP